MEIAQDEPMFLQDLEILPDSRCVAGVGHLLLVGDQLGVASGDLVLVGLNDQYYISPAGLDSISRQGLQLDSPRRPGQLH